jgi:DNA-binding NarL/FixJ family response regulator
MTDLQSEIMKQLTAGLTSKQIAYELKSTQKIVENNIVLMKSQFDAKNIPEMISNFFLFTLDGMLCIFGTEVAARERKKVYRENPEIKKRKKASVIQSEDAAKFLTSLHN